MYFYIKITLYWMGCCATSPLNEGFFIKILNLYHKNKGANSKNEITITFEKNNNKKSETLKFISNNKTPNQTIQNSSITFQILEVDEQKQQKDDTKKKSSKNYTNEKINFEEKPDLPAINCNNNNQSLKSIKEIVSPADPRQIKSISDMKHFSKGNSEISKEGKEERKSTKKGTNTSLGIKVGPEIFVSLKKGSISQYYTIGKTLGEGFMKLHKKYKFVYRGFWKSKLSESQNYRF